MKQKQVERVLELARREGPLRPRDLHVYGIAREYLIRMHKRGLLKRIARGMYVLPDANVTENHTLAEASKRVPQGIVSLLSALRLHGLTTQQPFEVWMAIGEKARRPRVDHPLIKFVRFSGPAMKMGVEEHRIEGVVVKVYNPAKTVADCFKYRNKIGLDVAIEALRDCRSKKNCTNEELWRYAKICRVSKIMKPYMEAIG